MVAFDTASELPTLIDLPTVLGPPTLVDAVPAFLLDESDLREGPPKPSRHLYLTHGDGHGKMIRRSDHMDRVRSARETRDRYGDPDRAPVSLTVGFAPRPSLWARFWAAVVRWVEG